MNPYDFVRVIWDRPGRRGPGPAGDRWSGLSGRLMGTITTETPLFIPDPNRAGTPKRFLRDLQGRFIIPGTSLKGLFRSLVETIDGGAWWFYGSDGVWRDPNVSGMAVDYSSKLPEDFQRPHTTRELDAACRMFGFLERATVLAGSVGFDDGVCDAPVRHPAIYTAVLSTPKPRHHVWYLDDQGRRVRGRKFYRHSTKLATASGWLPNAAVSSEQRMNAYIEPIGAGSVFQFSGHFSSVAPEDLALLLYAIALEPNMRHKLGYAKPAGLGSVHIALSQIDIVDHVARYRAGHGGITRYERSGPQGDTLTPFLQEQTRRYTDDTSSITLQDLRRIWAWPATYELKNPSRDWFSNNPNARIGETP